MADPTQETTEPMHDPEPSTYVPPPHRIAAVGDAWDVVDERLTVKGHGPETVNERLSDGDPDEDGNLSTVAERLSGEEPGVVRLAADEDVDRIKADAAAFEDEQSDEADEDEPAEKPAKPAAKRTRKS